MGCKCQEIRNAITKLPGGKFLVGMLPALPGKGQTMKMLASAPGQRVQTTTGHHYSAGDDRIAHDIDPDDYAELARIGWRPLAPVTTVTRGPGGTTVVTSSVGGARPPVAAAADEGVTDGELASADPTAAESHE
jgi:hypothetical protein